MAFITRNYSDGNTLTEAHLDQICDDIEAKLEVTKLSGDNLQTGGVPTAAVADAAITAAKLGTGAVTGVKLNADVVDDSTLQFTSSTLSIKDSGVSTAKIAANAVTRAKLASVGQQISASSGLHSVTTDGEDVTNLSVSLTTTGRPVFLAIISAGDVETGGGISVGTATDTNTITLKIYRDSTVVATYYLLADTSDANHVTPAGQVFIDVPSAGTYTYKVWAEAGGGSISNQIRYCKLAAFEL